MMLKKQILIVEDNLINREMLKAILEEQYRILEAENGLEALNLLKQRSDDIALILLDVMMPVMDGFTFLDLIKKDALLALIPVIVMTQSDSDADEVEALSHGAADFVPKPYRPQVILHRVASIINLRETAAMVNHFQYDQLTGLFSKEFFYQRAGELLSANPGMQYNIICSNIENFKLFNDLFGMEAGNRLLRQIAEYGVAQIGKRGICGRLSGDRFIGLCERRGVWDDQFFSNHVARINKLLNLPGNVVVKFGVYEVENRSVPVEQMCDRAMLAADNIKGQYNKFYALYDDELRSKLLREQAITDAMEGALKSGQFSVYLQPKYCLNDDALAGAEALVRWTHPELGFLSPGEFIPLFERNGFITKLDEYVWDRVGETLYIWRQKGYPLIPVSVNVSRADIYQSDLTDTLLGIVRKYEIDPSYLHLEITESAYTKNPGKIIAKVEQLRELGFIIEMDDFGSGYSSLNMLNQMKLDVLKLDMKFIQSETAKPMEQGILHFIVSLARWMNLSVVAEGVETREQLERLREIGCDYVQGYFFSKPMTVAQFEILLSTQGTHLSSVADKENSTKPSMHALLLADEDADYRALVKGVFDGEYRVLEAGDAATAISCLTSPGDTDVLFALVSITLPEQGAEKILQTMRKDPTLWRIPVVITFPGNDELENKAMDLEADDFLCKPHSDRSLQKRISNLLGLTLHQQREQSLQDAAWRDYLTDLFNRRGFHAAMEALRQEDLPLALYLFDLDDLKIINDVYGHEMGDKILCDFAGILRDHTREKDIVCRYGGDEFVVVLRHINSPDAVLKKGKEICQSLCQCVLPDGKKPSCSGGIAFCGMDEKPTAELIDRADKALYRAKRENRGGVCQWKE